MNSTGDDKALVDAILDAAADAIIVSDEKGLILRANLAAIAMFQHTEQDLVGHSVNELMPQAAGALHDRYLKQHIETGEDRIVGQGRDVEGVRKDGTRFPLHLSVGSATVGESRVFIGILHDLTQRKATEAALARSRRLNAIGQMTGGIAHDFNNWLTVIIGNLELLEMRNADQRDLNLIRDALHAATIGSDLIARLSAFGRRSDLNPVRVDLKALCEDTLVILKRTLGAKIQIKTDFAPVISLVMVDPVQLQSALMNLALNARDAMGDGGELLISVKNVRIDDDYMAQEVDVETGDYVCLSVSDNGEGMSPRAQEHVFEPFFTTKADRGGTGFGLATVYGFVKQSGGHITLYSEEGLGTSFGLYFPALEETATPAPSETDQKTRSNAPFGQGKTVLVVEDNAKVRKLSVARIRELGFDVEEAQSGDAAYAMLAGGMRADILFSDLVMPGDLNGYDLAALASREFPDVKVLLTSGYASDVVTTQLSQGKTYDILHKPYRQADLIESLQALFADDPDD